MESLKYLQDGSAVKVCQTVEGGYLVQDVYDTGGEENPEDFIISDNIYLVNAVYDKSPTSVLDKNISWLKSEIRNLELRKERLAAEAQEFEMKSNERSAKLRQYEQLKRLEDFLDGKITHYVDISWGAPKIISIEEAKSQESGSRDLRLLTLYGRTKSKSIDWNLNQYYDGSGGDTKVVPCTSEEEAIEVAKTDIASKLVLNENKYTNGDLIKAADKYGIPVPEDYRKMHLETTLNQLRRNLEQGNDSVRKTEEAINKLMAGE